MFKISAKKLYYKLNMHNDKRTIMQIQIPTSIM